MGQASDDNIDDLIDSLDISEPTEMRPIWEGFSVDKVDRNENPSTE